MREETMQFLIQNKMKYFHWLRQNVDSFPFCCVVSSNILASYLQVHYQEGEVVDGDFRAFNPNGSYLDMPHSWVMIGEEIVDFTYIQFELPSYESYDELYGNIYSDELIQLANKLDQFIIVNDKTLHSLYRVGYWKNAKPDPSFKKEAEGVDFLSFLERIEEIVSLSGDDLCNEDHLLR